MHTSNDQLLVYKAFKAKLLCKEIVLRFIAEACGEVLAVKGHKNTFGNSRNHWLQVWQNPNVFFKGLNNKYHRPMAQRKNFNNFWSTNFSSTTNQLGHNSTNNYQPHYKAWGTNQPRLVVGNYCKKKRSFEMWVWNSNND